MAHMMTRMTRMTRWLDSHDSLARWLAVCQDPFRLVSTLLAESLRSFDLSRKIEGDSVRRVTDQILGSSLLSYMAFSVYEVIRVSNACRKVGLFMFLRPGA